MLCSLGTELPRRSTRERLQVLNRGARERGWWDKYRDDISATYLDYVGFEAGAAFIRQFEAGFVPGLLQTPEYAEAVTVNTCNRSGLLRLWGFACNVSQSWRSDRLNLAGTT